VLMQRAVAAAEAEWSRRGKAAFFAALQPALEGSALARPQAEIAADLGVKVREVTLGLSRLRQLVGRFLYEEVTRTVAGTRDMAAEWQNVRQALEGA